MDLSVYYLKRKIWWKSFKTFFNKNSTYCSVMPIKKIMSLGLHNLIFMLVWLTIIFFKMTDNGITTESGGRQNMFPSETRPYIDESVSYDGYPQNAEKVNGRWAMVGFVALLGAYVTTGQIIPGIF